MYVAAALRKVFNHWRCLTAHTGSGELLVREEERESVIVGADSRFCLSRSVRLDNRVSQVLFGAVCAKWKFRHQSSIRGDSYGRIDH